MWRMMLLLPLMACAGSDTVRRADEYTTQVEEAGISLERYATTIAAGCAYLDGRGELEDYCKTAKGLYKSIQAAQVVAFRAIRIYRETGVAGEALGRALDRLEVGATELIDAVNAMAEVIENELDSESDTRGPPRTDEGADIVQPEGEAAEDAQPGGGGEGLPAQPAGETVGEGPQASGRDEEDG